MTAGDASDLSTEDTTPFGTAEAATEVALTLQRGLAPEALPAVPGLAIQARYRAGGAGAVGGDWYDALDLPGAGAAVVMGDVAGHGIPAATTMGQLRHAARAYLMDDHDPGSVLERLNRLTSWVLPGEVASALIVVFEPAGDQVRLACAGHLPPLLVTASTADFVTLASGPALGVMEEGAYEQTVLNLRGGRLLLYTDGLVERRGEVVDAGMQRLAAAVAEHAVDEDLLHRLVETVPDPNADDDLAVLVVGRSDGD